MKYTNTFCRRNVEYHNVIHKGSTVQYKIPKCLTLKKYKE